MTSKKVTAIIQARMGSTRLPGKSLMKIGKKTLIERVIDRIKLAKKIEQIVLATTDQPEDNKLVSFVTKKYPDVKIFRGNTLDVLDRYYQAALQYDANPIVRITADDPFKDPVVIDNIINHYLANTFDYVSNTIAHTFPEGIDVEVVSFTALQKAYQQGKGSLDREHVTYFIWKNPKIFNLHSYESKENNSMYRLTLDYPQDLELAKEIYKHFYPRIDFSYQEIVNFLKENPEIVKINGDIAHYGSIKI